MVRETSLSPEPHRPRAPSTKGRSCPLEPRPFHGDQAGFRAPLETHAQPYADWIRTMVFAHGRIEQHETYVASELWIAITSHCEGNDIQLALSYRLRMKSLWNL
jgi:hypothetical protein